MKLGKAFKAPPLHLQKQSLIYPALWQMIDSISVCVCVCVCVCGENGY